EHVVPLGEVGQHERVVLPAGTLTVHEHQRRAVVGALAVGERQVVDGRLLLGEPGVPDGRGLAVACRRVVPEVPGDGEDDEGDDHPEGDQEHAANQASTRAGCGGGSCDGHWSWSGVSGVPGWSGAVSSGRSSERCSVVPVVVVPVVPGAEEGARARPMPMPTGPSDGTNASPMPIPMIAPQTQGDQGRAGRPPGSGPVPGSWVVLGPPSGGPACRCP